MPVLFCVRSTVQGGGLTGYGPTGYGIGVWLPNGHYKIKKSKSDIRNFY